MPGVQRPEAVEPLRSKGGAVQRYSLRRRMDPPEVRRVMRGPPPLIEALRLFLSNVPCGAGKSVETRPTRRAGVHLQTDIRSEGDLYIAARSLEVAGAVRLLRELGANGATRRPSLDRPQHFIHFDRAARGLGMHRALGPANVDGPARGLSSHLPVHLSNADGAPRSGHRRRTGAAF